MWLICNWLSNYNVDQTFSKSIIQIIDNKARSIETNHSCSFIICDVQSVFEWLLFKWIAHINHAYDEWMVTILKKMYEIRNYAYIIKCELAADNSLCKGAC